MSDHFTPFTFNVLKHHMIEIKNFVQKFDKPFDELGQALKHIGHAKMDIYTGSLSCEEIFNHIETTLKNKGVFEIDMYKNWLAESGNFRELTLPDNTIWVLRLGENPLKYIHIHPGKKSEHTIRIKANTVKTAIALKLHENRLNEEITLEVTNQIRQQYLSLSPMRNMITTQQLAPFLNRL